MGQKLNYIKASPRAFETMLGFESYLKQVVSEGGLDESLIGLIKTRASQINRCGYCLDMHTKDARANGETEQRLHTLCNWQDAPFFTAKEKAALRWCEALTQIAVQHPNDDILGELRSHFSDTQITDLTLAICAINSWNRFAIGFGAEIGSYQVGDFD